MVGDDGDDRVRSGNAGDASVVVDDDDEDEDDVINSCEEGDASLASSDLNCPVLCSCTNTVSADVIHPLHAKQSLSDTVAVFFTLSSFICLKCPSNAPAAFVADAPRFPVSRTSTSSSMRMDGPLLALTG